MIDYIIYPNRRIDQDLLLDGIFWHNVNHNVPILLRIVDATIREIPLNNSYELKMYFGIRTAKFKCKAYHYNNGLIDKTKTEVVNASGETILAKYLIKGTNDHRLRVEVYDPAFNLINYALQQYGAIARGNRHGLKNINATILETSLKNLDFKAIVKEDANGQLILNARPKNQTKVV